MTWFRNLWLRLRVAWALFRGRSVSPQISGGDRDTSSDAPALAEPLVVYSEIPEDKKTALDRRADRVRLHQTCTQCDRESTLKTKREALSAPRKPFVCADCRSTMLPEGTTVDDYVQGQKVQIGLTPK